MSSYLKRLHDAHLSLSIVLMTNNTYIATHTYLVVSKRKYGCLGTLMILWGRDVMVMCVSRVRPEVEAFLWGLALETSIHIHNVMNLKSNISLASDMGVEALVRSCLCWFFMIMLPIKGKRGL